MRAPGVSRRGTGFLYAALAIVSLALLIGEVGLLALSGVFPDTESAVFLVFLSACLLVVGWVGLRFALMTKGTAAIAVLGAAAYVLVISSLFQESIDSRASEWQLTADRLNRLELEVSSYVAAHNACPPSLESITGSPLEAIDYFANGRQLSYRARGNECVLYSVGLDGVDDLGRISVGPDGLRHHSPSSILSWSLFYRFHARRFDDDATRGDIVRIVRVERPTL